MSSVHKNLELGRERLDVGDYAGALSHIDAALTEDAGSVDALELRSRVLYLMGRDVEALHTLRQVRAARQRGFSDDFAGFPEENADDTDDDDTGTAETLETLLALRERYPLDGELMSLLAELAEEAGRYEIARVVLEELVAAEPDRIDAWEGLVHALSHEDLDTASDVLAVALERFPNHPLFHEFNGFIHYRRGQYRQAVAAYRHAIELGADHAGNYQAMVLGYLALGKVEDALEVTRLMMLYAGQDADAHQFAIEVALQCDALDMATHHAHQLVRLQPTHAETYCYKAWAEIMSEEWECAERTLRLGFHKAADGAFALFMLVDLLLSIGMPEEAHRVAVLVNELNPDHPESGAALGKALRELGNFPEALQAFRQAAAVAPQDDVFRTWMGIVLDNMGDYHEALRQYDDVLSRHPADVWTLCNRGLTYLAMEEDHLALADFNRCIDIDPLDGQPFFWRASLLVRQGDNEGALRDLRRALDLSDDIYAWIEQEPLLDPLRNLPAFRELLFPSEEE